MQLSEKHFILLTYPFVAKQCFSVFKQFIYFFFFKTKDVEVISFLNGERKIQFIDPFYMLFIEYDAQPFLVCLQTVERVIH